MVTAARIRSSPQSVSHERAIHLTIAMDVEATTQPKIKVKREGLNIWVDPGAEAKAE